MSSTTYQCRVDITLDVSIPNKNLKEYLKENPNDCAQDLVEDLVSVYLRQQIDIFRFGLEEEPANVFLQSIDDTNIEGEEDDAEPGFWDDEDEEARPAPKSAPKETAEAQKHLTTSQGQNAQSSASAIG